MTRKSLFIVLLVPTLLLLVPLVANQTVDGFDWDPGSFIVAWVLMVAVGFVYKLVTSKTGNIAHRVATALALLGGFMIIWGNLAVGFIGSEDNPANLLYAGVLLIGAIGGAMARFESAGMARTMFATAFAQFLVPAIAWLLNPQDFSPGLAQVFGLNACFVMLFVVSGALFRRASRNRMNTAGREGVLPA